jgi:hypothetical protein
MFLRKEVGKDVAEEGANERAGKRVVKEGAGKH